MKKVSIVVPIYNEGSNVSKLIDILLETDDIYEVIFSDASDDGDAKKIIEANGFTYIKSPKGRAFQMNEGFKQSSGDIVFFLHCDSKIEKNCISSIIKANESGVNFGCLTIAFDDTRLLMKICGFMSNFRVNHRKIVFGDQGMFFSRELFSKLNGFAEIPIMEDYDISIRAKKFEAVTRLNDTIITSSRKYYKGYGRFNCGKLSFIGILLNMWDMQVYQHKFRSGSSLEEINKMYYKNK